MPPLILIPVVAFIAYELWRSAHGDALDLSSVNVAIKHALSTLTGDEPSTDDTGESDDSVDTGNATPPNQPPPPKAPAAPGSPITTQKTTTEPERIMRLVQPRTQPKAPSAANEQVARALALQIESALATNPDGPRYRTLNASLFALIKHFQSALGLGSDGLYGPTTAGALMYFLGHSPPPPFFYIGERVINLYAPL